MSTRLLHRAFAVFLACAAFLPVLAVGQEGEPAPAEVAASTAEETKSSNMFMAFVMPGYGENGFEKGALFGFMIIILLLLMSIFVCGFSILMLLKNRRQDIVPDDLRDELEDLIADKKFREAIEVAEEEECYLGRICYASLKEAPHGYTAMERALEDSSDAEATKLLRPLEILNVMGNISPMIGLFGTVFGMIVAFQVLVEAGGSADPTKLAGGISTALVTTLWGLVVAIPAMTLYALIRNRVDMMASEGMTIAAEMIAPFKPKKKKSSSSNRPSSSPRP